jgi:signal transduction histidine kinase
VDYQLIGRVIQNLLSNAIKYSPAGSTVTLRARREGDSIVTEVEDEGIGISEEDREKLFDRFFRVRSESGRSRPGAGLGLAICKEIVAAHRGEIWVNSTQGAGSTFAFSLPIAVD